MWQLPGCNYLTHCLLRNVIIFQARNSHREEIFVGITAVPYLIEMLNNVTLKRVKTITANLKIKRRWGKLSELKFSETQFSA